MPCSTERGLILWRIRRMESRIVQNADGLNKNKRGNRFKGFGADLFDYRLKRILYLPLCLRRYYEID